MKKFMKFSKNWVKVDGYNVYIRKFVGFDQKIHFREATAIHSWRVTQYYTLLSIEKSKKSYWGDYCMICSKKFSGSIITERMHVEKLYIPYILLGINGFPVIDLHVEIKNGLSIIL